jgi:hypothetical protein
MPKRKKSQNVRVWMKRAIGVTPQVQPRTDSERGDWVLLVVRFNALFSD